jgi:transposase-like protein
MAGMAERPQTNQIGRRYVCPVCGSEFIVTRASTGQRRPLTCHGQVMALKG